MHHHNQTEQQPDDEAILRHAAELQQRKLKELNERVTSLLKGEAKPPNEFVAYLLRQIRGARQEHEEVNQQIQQLTSQLQTLRQRQAGIEGGYNNRIADLQHWDRELEIVRPEKKLSVEGGLGEPELKMVSNTAP